jgi:hypothetical protein
VPTGGALGTPFSCTANVSVPPALRQEGVTEAVGDIVLVCSGGSALPAGAPVPFANFTITLGTQVTSRILSTSGATGGASNSSEALLLIDEPGATNLGGPGPMATQTTCAAGSGYAGAGTPGSANTGGPATGCAAIVNGTGQASPSLGGTMPNVFQGLVSGFQVTFQGVPVLPPVTAGLTRVFRFTNIRANAAGVPAGLGGVGQLLANIIISGSTSVPVSNPVQTVGFVQTSLTTSLRASNSTSGGSNHGFQQCNNVTTGFVNLLRYSENFATAFKTRVVATANNTGQAGPVNQNIPGGIFNSESDFVTTALANAGLADFGTRLRAVFSNVPSGVRLFVSTTNVLNGTTIAPAPSPIGGTSTSPFAQLVVSETAPDSNGFVPAVPVSGTCGQTSGFTGCGNLTLAEIPVINGVATAVWEVVNTNPAQNEDFFFGAFVSFAGNQANGTPPAGTSTVDMSYAPVIANSAVASATLPIPRFVDLSTPVNNFNIGLCRTILLFPYVTNAIGLETGIAIANTSTDPLGQATPQAGTCAFTLYGNQSVPTWNPNKTILSGNSNASTSDWAFTLSSVPGVATGFQGYMIAVCNFQYAHGFAYISDVGVRNLSMGYLALVLQGNDDHAFSRNDNNTAERIER